MLHVQRAAVVAPCRGAGGQPGRIGQRTVQRGIQRNRGNARTERPVQPRRQADAVGLARQSTAPAGPASPPDAARHPHPAARSSAASIGAGRPERWPAALSPADPSACAARIGLQRHQQAQPAGAYMRCRARRPRAGAARPRPRSAAPAGAANRAAAPRVSARQARPSGISGAPPCKATSRRVSVAASGQPPASGAAVLTDQPVARLAATQSASPARIRCTAKCQSQRSRRSPPPAAARSEAPIACAASPLTLPDRTRRL